MRHLLFLCPFLKIHLPAFEADLFLFVLPAPQAGQWNSGIAAEGLSPHAQLLPVNPDSLGLSIEKELVVLIQKVGSRNPVELGQVENQTPRQASCDAALDIDIHAAADTCDLGSFPLRQPLTVPEPAEPVQDGGDFLVGTV